MTRPADKSTVATGVFSTLLARRWTAAVPFALALLQVAWSASDLPGWRCPVRASLGIRCPTCGLTRAMLALGRADLTGMLAYHALSPLLALGLLVTLLAIGLPRGARDRMVQGVAALEARGLTFVVLGALLGHWLVVLARSMP